MNSNALHDGTDLAEIGNDVEPEQTLAISEEDATYLQDVEHFGGFVLGDRAFPKINNAIKQQDWETFETFFAPEFEGEIFVWEEATSSQFDFASFDSWTSESSLRTVNRTEFVAAIKELREEFRELERSGFKVMQMAPEYRGEFDRPWSGSFKLSMAGKNSAGKIAFITLKFSCRIAFISETTPDATEYILSCTTYEGKYGTADRFLMEDITSTTGITNLGLRDNWKYDYTEGQTRPFVTGGIFANDFNQDGNTDFLLTDLDGLFFYVGDGNGNFTEQSIQVGLQRFIKEPVAVVADFNNDTFEDLIIGQSLYVNEQGKKFRKLTDDEFTVPLAKRLGSLTVADFDKDGLVDLMEVGVIVKEGAHGWINNDDGGNRATENRLWKNMGDFKFSNVTEPTNTIGLGTGAFSAVWFDANGDQWPDCMMACEFGRNDYFLNNGDGTFTMANLPGSHGGFSMGITVADIDNDGFGDPYLANMYSKAGERIVGNIRSGLYKEYNQDIAAQLEEFVSGNELYHNNGDGTFKRIGRQVGVNDVGWAYGTGAVDLNGDGYQEIYAPVGFQSVTEDKPDG
ncbi:MAG: VCBS repeat-containing protein [Planctomycetota bacterium]|nr:VCBS repeat-containing protein [Planctomycetota bacterium]